MPPGALTKSGHLQPAHDAVAVIAAGHRLALVGAQQDVFVEVKGLRRLVRELELALGAEALHLVDIERELAVARLVVRLGHLVVEVVLRLEADGAGLQLHVDVLRDEDRRRRETFPGRRGPRR
jgi:hypothetical protein